jgi:S-adenosylmethionine synthetase
MIVRSVVVDGVITELPQYQQVLFDDKTIYKINHIGTFVQCGPAGDTGLTGRKIVVDHGYYSVGGGAFSGKDSTKVDRSGAYFARYLAKNMVAAGVADEVTMHIAYVIGDTDATSVLIKTKNNKTKYSDAELSSKIREIVSFKPQNIINKLKLKQPIFSATAQAGHFGFSSFSLDSLEFFTWEKRDLVEKFKNVFLT